MDMESLMNKKREAEEEALARQVATNVHVTPPAQQDPESMFGPPEIEPSEIELGEEIGTGSFGKVYRGRCRQKPVAVKILHRQLIDKKAMIAFKREVKIMSKIFHPNICLFMGACIVPGQCMIITEMCPHGNLENMLKDKNVQMSNLTKIKIARDAALGMNWLHCSNPVFIHRDLKSSNLLIDENFHVKVCDFGLSQLIPRDKKVRDKQNAKGTPLWMAPEVMMFKEFNEKCDVYSYGIVLWEILTREEPFAQYTSFDKFKEAVCVRHERPPIPADTVPSLKQLIEDCWDPEPNRRPSFKEIITRLEYIMVDMAIEDEGGRQFWKRNFLGKDEVTWSEFIQALYTFLHTPASEQSADSIATKCLRALVAEKPKKETAVQEVVNIDQFGKILAWFGPLVVPSAVSSAPGPASSNNNNNIASSADAAPAPTVTGDVDVPAPASTPATPDATAPSADFLTRIRNVLQKSWFHGDISTSDAQIRLGNLPGGSFLVRFSSTQPGCYTISSLTADLSSIKHQRILYQAGKGFNFNNQWFPSLEDVIRSIDYLTVPAPGSKFQALFNQSSQSIIGYS